MDNLTLNVYAITIGFCLPQRIVLAFMTFLGFMCEYMMRNLLSIAITQIAKKTYYNESIISGEVCAADNETLIDDDGDGIFTEGTYEWSEALQGVILSSFYWGYIITHIPGGGILLFFISSRGFSIPTLLRCACREVRRKIDASCWNRRNEYLDMSHASFNHNWRLDTAHHKSSRYGTLSGLHLCVSLWTFIDVDSVERANDFGSFCAEWNSSESVIFMRLHVYYYV